MAFSYICYAITKLDENIYLRNIPTKSTKPMGFVIATFGRDFSFYGNNLDASI